MERADQLPSSDCEIYQKKQPEKHMNTNKQESFQFRIPVEMEKQEKSDATGNAGYSKS
jgi:hypothetical protein